MTKQNFTAKKSVLQPSVRVGDVFTNNKGCSAIVIKYINASRVLIEFNDNHKHRAYVSAKNIRSGSIKNPYYPSVCGVGCIGVGDYISHANGRHTDEYQTWRDMIRRCYDADLKKKIPTYDMCSVHDSWLNFQAFAEWYTEQDYYGAGYHLDKDLLVEGNKIYSAKTCALIPAELNLLLNDRARARGRHPIGVHYYKRLDKYAAGIHINNKVRHLGYFSCVNEASQAYVTAKKIYIKSKALEWQDRIDSRVFQALMRRTV